MSNRNNAEMEYLFANKYFHILLILWQSICKNLQKLKSVKLIIISPTFPYVGYIDSKITEANFLSMESVTR